MLEELKELFFELCQKKQNLSEEKVLELKQAFESEMRTIEEVVSLAARNDFVPVLEYFAKNGGDLHCIVKECEENVNLLNIAVAEGSFDVVNYLFAHNFTVDQRVSENARTPFHSAVEWNNIEAVKRLLKKGANINAEYEFGRVKTALHDVFIYRRDADGVEYNHIDMAKFLIKYGIQIPDNIDELRDDVVIRLSPIKEPIKDFLVSIKQLENLQGNDFINAYEALAPEVQEIWDIRVSRDHLKELAKFISNKFSSETIIEYQEYAALREYSSLPKHKKDALELFLPDTNFTFDDLVIVDNYIEDHSLEFDDIKIAGADSNT